MNLQPGNLSKLQENMLQHNPYVAELKYSWEILMEKGRDKINLAIRPADDRAPRDVHARTYDAPTASESPQSFLVGPMPSGERQSW